jgi:hypothetical protein
MSSEVRNMPSFDQFKIIFRIGVVRKSVSAALTITYIQANIIVLKHASTDNSNMSIYKQIRSYKGK